MSSNPKGKHLMNGKETNKGKWFQKWKSWNPNGQPRKLFSSINLELKAKGVTPITRSQLLEAYSLIFNSTEEELKKLSEDKSVPYVLRLIIGELNNKNTRSKALADYRDYMFGKATQNIDEKHSWSVTLIDGLINLTKAKQKKEV